MAWHLQAGSCRTVGISGHILGGCQGPLARSHGPTCDSLLELTLVDSQLRILTVTERSEHDLYWACKGGGGGSFGIATQFRLHVFPLKSALVSGVTSKLSQSAAARLFAAWQAWVQNAPSNVTSIMKVQSAGGGKITLRCTGQSVGSEAELRTQLQVLVAMDKPSSVLSIQSLSFLNAVKHFVGPLDYESVYMKAKSDYMLTPLDADAIDAMMTAASAASTVALLCDGYGGKIADVAAADTAFLARGHAVLHPVLFELEPRGLHPAHLVSVAKFYTAMRPFMPGASYVNYCDLDLPDYANAYWGDDLPRLMAVKQQYDPDNLLHHAQSVLLPFAPVVRPARSSGAGCCYGAVTPGAVTFGIAVAPGALRR